MLNPWNTLSPLFSPQTLKVGVLGNLCGFQMMKPELRGIKQFAQVTSWPTRGTESQTHLAPGHVSALRWGSRSYGCAEVWLAGAARVPEPVGRAALAFHPSGPSVIITVLQRGRKHSLT